MNVIPLPSPPTYLSWAEDVVEVLQEGLVLDFIVGEDEGDTLAFLPLLTSPELRTLLRYSRKASSLISLSVEDEGDTLAFSPYLPLLSWGRCWGTPGRPRPWFHCRWRWMWYPCLLPLLTSPELRTLLRYSRKASSLISLSVKMKVIPLPPPLLTSPELRTLLRHSRKASSLDFIVGEDEGDTLASPSTYLSWAEDIVEVLQEGLVLDFVVGEDEGDTLASPSTYLSWAEDIVEVLQEGLVLDFVVSEDEGDTLASPYLPSSWAEDIVEVLQEGLTLDFVCRWRWRWYPCLLPLLTSPEDVVEVLQEGLVLDFVVGEDEGDTSDDFSCWRKYLKQAGGRGGRHKAPS